MSSSAYEQAWRALWLFGGVLAILYVAGSALLPFIIGALVAWSLRPAQAWLTSIGVPTALSATALTLFIFTVIAALLVYSIPALVQAVDALLQAGQSAFPDVIATLENLTGMSIAKPAEAVIDDVTSGDLEPLIEPATSATPLALSLVGSTLNAILLMLITPVVIFYLLWDWDVVERAIQNWLPADTAAELLDIWEISKERGLQYIWGRAIVVFWLSLIHILGLWLIGLDGFWLVGLLAGVSVIVPIVGNIASLGIALVVGLIQSPDVGFLLGIVAVFAVAQILEMVWIEPYFLGSTMDMHPFLVLLVLMLGGHLLGAVGAIIALPVAAIALGILEGARALQEKRQSNAAQQSAASV